MDKRDELETADGFDDLMADATDDGEPEKIGMAVPPRFKTSAEAEEAERRYLERVMSKDLSTALLPIPFFSDDSNVCDPPTPADAKDLWDKFRITVEEYQELMS